MKPLTGYLRKAQRVAYWALPPLVFAVIFIKIDLQRLAGVMSGAYLPLVFLGLAARPVALMLGALRWNALSACYSEAPVPLRYSLKHFAIGFATGAFVPGALGLDLYRVSVAGSSFGNYLGQAAAVFLEKIFGLVTASILVVLVYPLAPFQAPSALVEDIVAGAYAAILLGALGLAGASFLGRRRAGKVLLRRLDAWLAAFVTRVRARLRLSAATGAPIGFSRVLAPIAQSRSLFVSFGLSFALHVSAAFGSYLYFQSTGEGVPLLAVLFVTPLLIVINGLPISFGGLGVREAGFILLYSLFGVPAELALFASICSFMSLLSSYAIGGLVLLLAKPNPQRASASGKPAD